MKETIIHAVVELTSDGGFQGATTAMIVHKACISVGSIYRHFESKDDLILKTYAFLNGQILASVMAGYPEGRPIRERFLHVGLKLVDYFIAKPMEFRFMEQFHCSPYGAASHNDKAFDKEIKNILLELIDEGRREQVFKELPRQVIIALTMGPLTTICRNHIMCDIVLDTAIITRTIEGCWDAVRR
ncbi:TetR/AcrR family transcriptional regulator [Oryzomonas rubra]|nr:TetR/AcrR family transcriptional regulator [Oryzomonas rubra]